VHSIEIPFGDPGVHPATTWSLHQRFRLSVQMRDGELDIELTPGDPPSDGRALSVRASEFHGGLSVLDVATIHDLARLVDERGALDERNLALPHLAPTSDLRRRGTPIGDQGAAACGVDSSKR
jgi:hypothetical protein